MIHYTKFTLKNFRSFTQEQSLKFAKPISDKLGSGITYIVGANNSGKTTLIESLWFHKDCSLNDSERRKDPPEFRFYDGDNRVKTVELLHKDASRFKEDPPSHQREDLFEIISSRRQWDSAAGDTRTSDQIISQSLTGTKPRGSQNLQVASILKALESNEGRREKFTALVKRVIPEFSSWAIGHENHDYIKYISTDGVTHKSDFLGDGVISVIRILAHLFEERKSGLIIDEPELSLHPLAQKRLARIISEYAQDRQIILSTHSPYFISWEYFKNGATLNRVAKESDTHSCIYTLAEYNSYEKLIKGSNWQQPFLMDVVSKEIFFQDNILFVEGQEDVGLLQKEFENLEINLFGYGVRGCNNFKLAFKLAKDLGIKKACVLIDSPDQASGEKKEDKIKEELEEKYGEFGYEVVQWKKADIRDKKAVTFPEKEGYFTEDGDKKSLEQLGDFNEKIQMIQNYFIK